MTISIEPNPSSYDAANDSILVRTTEGRINSWNRSSVALYGWKEDEAIGRISHDLLQTRFPKPLEEIESELVQNKLWEGHLVHTTRNGGRIVVKSRWAYDTNGSAERIIEINAPCEHYDSDSESSKKKIEEVLAKVANSVFIGGGLLLILVSFYYFYYYEWTAQRQFTDSIRKVIYLFFPIGVASFLFASLRLKPKNKLNVAILGISLAFSLLCAELFLELWGASLSVSRKPAMLNIMEYSTDKLKGAAELTKKFGIEIDTRTASEVISSLQKEGVEAVPILVPGNSFVEGPNNSIKSVLKIRGEEIIPLGGISNRVTVLCNESGQWVSYKSDKHGFNNPNEAWQYSPIEIGILGDSYAHGFCVSPDRNFSALIRQRYSATLNLAMAGAGPMLELATWEEYLQPFQPKIVLWFYYEGNDLIDLQKERKSKLLMRYLNGNFSQNLIALQSEIDQAIREDIPRQSELSVRRTPQASQVGVIDKVSEFLRLSKLRKELSLVNSTTVKEIKNQENLQGPDLAIFRDILAQVKNRVGTWGGKVYFVYLPDWSRYGSVDVEPAARQRDSVLELVKTLGIPVIDIDPVFQAQRDPLTLFPFREPGHYTEKGHSLVSEEVMRTISSTR